MEEAAGDCTNLHMFYPAFVYGFWSLIRATRPGAIPEDAVHILKPALKGGTTTNEIRVSDLAFRADGRVANQVIQYAQALEGLAGRTGVRDDVSKYEAVAMSMVSPDGTTIGEVLTDFPASNSILDSQGFFKTIFREYDMRFVYQAPAMASTTRRHIWDPESPVLKDSRAAEIAVRIGDETDDADGHDLDADSNGNATEPTS